MVTTSVFVVLFFARVISNSGVFRFHGKEENNVGILMYSFYLEDNEDEVQCLRACYEERECRAVHYNKEERSCQLVKKGMERDFGELYVLYREETDSSCMTETSFGEIPFQSIPKKGDTSEKHCNHTTMPDVAVLQPYDHLGNYRFFLHSYEQTPIDCNATEPRLFFSRKAEETCISVPVFRKANRRRLYFGEIYNTTGYFFYDAYAFADYCVSPLGECLGVEEIQEYKDEKGNFFYDMAGIENMTDSGLRQTFFIARLEYDSVEH